VIRALLAGAVLLGLGVVAGCSHVRIPAAAGSAGGRARALPLRPFPVRGDTGRVFAIVLTGDGPTGGLGKELRYYWNPQSPEQSARDLDAVIRHYASAWGRDRVVLVGYSMGADVLPFLVNRLPDDSRHRVAGMALLALAHDAVFEFRFEQWWGTSSAPRFATRPEVEKLAGLRVLCVWGVGDDKAACPLMRTAPMREVQLRGGHQFKGDQKRLLRVVREFALED
jgi:type IV secretory pathway VirJ component